VSWRNIRAVMRKEIQHIVRDRGTFFMVLITPTMILMIMAYALTVDLEHIPIAVLDQNRTKISRAFVQQITAGDDLDLYAQVGSIDEIEVMLVKGEIKAAIILAPDFSETVLSLRGLPMQVIIDGTEPESGNFAVDHIGQRVERFIREAMSDQMQALGIPEESLLPIDLRVRAWYNPGLEPRVDMIPGLISMVLGFPALSVALALAHEREHGTLEQLMVSPIGRADLLIGKMIPYIFVGMANVLFMPILAMLWFDIPFNGNFPLFMLLSAFFLFAILSMGIIIGVFMHTQAAAMAVSFLLIFFPGFFLTGIFFPIAAMPEIMRMEAIFLPGTHYAVITRGLFLTAVGMDVLWPYAVMLVGLGILFTGVAALFFRKRLG
jgi:ABC-2 type transport system permease protein